MAPCNFSTAEVAILLNNPNMDSAAGQKFPEEGKRPTIDRQRLGQSGQRWRNYCSQVELFYWFFFFLFCLLFFLEFIAWLIPCFHHIVFFLSLYPGSYPACSMSILPMTYALQFPVVMWLSFMNLMFDSWEMQQMAVKAGNSEKEGTSFNTYICSSSSISSSRTIFPHECNEFVVAY